jgi:hypothetical protein
MDTIPPELFILFVPDPDTLGRMLRVCKWISAALTAGGSYKLIDQCHADTDAVSDFNVKVSNGAVTFALLFDEAPYLICAKIHGYNHGVDKYTFEQLHQLAGIPKYMRVSSGLVSFMSGVGWDSIRYHCKYMLVSQRAGSCSYKGSTRHDTLLISNLEGNIADFNTTFITSECTLIGNIYVTGPHMIYKKIT